MIETAAAKKTSSDWEDLPWDEAIDFLREKAALSPAEFSALEAWARSQSFTVAGVTKLDVIQKTLDSLMEITESGGTLAEFRDSLGDIFSAAGIDELSPWRAETLFRTTVQSAYGRGQWLAFQESQDNTTAWGWRYRTVGDDRVRESHAALDGNIFEGNDGAQYFPPWDFNCRCHAEIISTEEAQREGYDGSDAIPDASKNDFSDFTSPALGIEWRPDLMRYAPSPLSDYMNEMSNAHALDQPTLEEEAPEYPELPTEQIVTTYGEPSTHPEEIQAAIREQEDFIWKEKHEWSASIDPEDGSLIGQWTSSDPDRVKLPSKFKNKIDDSINLHNHPARVWNADGTPNYSWAESPYDTSFSMSDVAFAVEHNLREARVIAGDQVYGLTRVGESWPSQTWFRDEINGTIGDLGWGFKIREEMEKAVRSGAISQTEADVTFWRNLWRKLAEIDGGEHFRYWEAHR